MRRLAKMGPRAAPAVPLLVKMAHRAVEIKQEEIMERETKKSATERRLYFQALETLKQIGERAVTYLLKDLEDREFAPRLMALGLLGELGDRRAVEPLLDALITGGWTEEYAAMVSLAQLRATEAAEPLLTALEDTNPATRDHALLALGMIYSREDATQDMVIPPAVVERILTRLEDWNPVVRRQAARAVGEMRLESAAEPLRKMLRDEDEAVRAEAKRVLDELGLSRAGLGANGTEAEK
jgi:HEAT repeat protein